MRTRGHKAWNSRRLATEAYPPRNVLAGRQRSSASRRPTPASPTCCETPAAVRFLSVEPLLEFVNFMRVLIGQKLATAPPDDWRPEAFVPPPRLHWVIAGSESGPGARRMDEAWVRSLRDQCAAAKVSFFYKQRLEAGRKVSLPVLDGRQWSEFPATGARQP
jgi:protein gp37